jgi:hypothetical protein
VGAFLLVLILKYSIVYSVISRTKSNEEPSFSKLPDATSIGFENWGWILAI